MVNPETRNNLIVVVIIVAVAILIVGFIYAFSNSLLQVAQHGENTVNLVGKSVSGNVSEATDINRLNLQQFNRSMTDVIASNDKIVVSNNNSIANLTGLVDKFSKSNSIYLGAVTNNTSANKGSLIAILTELKKQTALLTSIDKKLTNTVPIVPLPPVVKPDSPDCIIKAPKICILASPANNATNNATK